MKFALATVVFPGVKLFFSEFLQSLENQTDPDFQLLIVNDGCCLADFDLSAFQYTEIQSGGSIQRNRELLIREADNQGFEWIVFADADDWFGPNRIEVIKELTSDYDLIANEIVPFIDDEFSEPKFEKILGPFQQIDLDFIRDKNLFGLSNVACRTRFLKDILIPDEIIAVDWFLFTKAMQKGARACFTSETITYYRQWRDNIIGTDAVSEKAIKTGVRAKYIHYKYLAGTDSWFSDNVLWLQDLILELETAEFKTYLNKVRQQGSSAVFWWENIKNYENG